MVDMCAIEPYTCELDSDTNATLKMYLFQNVQNIQTIQNNIIKGVWKCAVVKPSLILDPFQVVVAANRAAVCEKQNTMVTRTVFAEILYNLSLTKNISQSLSKFGIEKDKEILVCFLTTQEEDDSSNVLSQIEGDQIPIKELINITNVKNVKSVYKLNNLKNNTNLLDIIVSRMVTKHFVSH